MALVLLAPELLLLLLLWLSLLSLGGPPRAAPPALSLGQVLQKWERCWRSSNGQIAVALLSACAQKRSATECECARVLPL
eukprot:1144238-Pelagomonas_calceolata.AAC.3